MSAPYDYTKRRWAGFRPHGTRWSEMVLGRRRTQEALLRDRVVTVSCYDYKGVMRYSDPVKSPPRAGSKVLYRIRVTWKGPRP